MILENSIFCINKVFEFFYENYSLSTTHEVTKQGWKTTLLLNRSSFEVLFACNVNIISKGWVSHQSSLVFQVYLSEEIVVLNLNCLDHYLKHIHYWTLLNFAFKSIKNILSLLALIILVSCHDLQHESCNKQVFLSIVSEFHYLFHASDKSDLVQVL